MPARPLRVIVADDARIVRGVLRTVLQSLGHTVVGEAASLQETVAAVLRLEPEVAFIDVALLCDGPEASLARIRAACHTTRVVVCGPLERSGDVRRTVAAGASGAVVRPFRRSRVADAAAAAR